MKASLEMLRQRLYNHVNEHHYEETRDTLHYPRPSFYEGEGRLWSERMVLCPEGSFPEDWEVEPGAAVVSMKPLPDFLRKEGLFYLVLDGFSDPYSWSNAIFRVFDEMDAWDLKIQRILQNHGSLQELLDASEPIFGNGLSVMDANYHIVARTSLLIFDAGEGIQDLDEFGRLHEDQVNAFKNNEAYQKIKNEKEIFYYADNLFTYRTLCKNLFLDDVFLYRIVLFENCKPLTRLEEQLLEHLSRSILEDPSYLSGVGKKDHEAFAAILQKMILQREYNEQDIQEQVYKLGWNGQDVYTVAYILASQQDVYNATLSYFSNKIMYDFRHTFAFTMDQVILVLINHTRIGKERDAFYNRLNFFIREGNFRVGYSNPMVGLKSFYKAYHQGEGALRLGSKHHPSIWTHRFSEQVLPYLIAKGAEDVGEEGLISPVHRRLMDYDEKNGTEYVMTLDQYLRNNGNAVKTAKDLNIHRATFIYRMERIKEIGKWDMTDEDAVLHMRLSLKLHRLSEYQM